MNKTQKELMQLSNELGCQTPKIETRTFCPWCDKFTLYLKEHKLQYKCLNCEREGDIEEVKQKYYGDFMRQKSSVHI